jgi:hypothetical protein
LKNVASLGGTVTLRMVVALNGAITEVSFPEETIGSARVLECIHDQAMRWKLAPMKGPVGLTLDLPVVFKSKH